MDLLVGGLGTSAGVAPRVHTARAHHLRRAGRRGAQRARPGAEATAGARQPRARPPGHSGARLHPRRPEAPGHAADLCGAAGHPRPRALGARARWEGGAGAVLAPRALPEPIQRHGLGGAARRDGARGAHRFRAGDAGAARRAAERRPGAAVPAARRRPRCWHPRADRLRGAGPRTGDEGGRRAGLPRRGRAGGERWASMHLVDGGAASAPGGWSAVRAGRRVEGPRLRRHRAAAVGRERHLGRAEPGRASEPLGG